MTETFNPGQYVEINFPDSIQHGKCGRVQRLTDGLVNVLVDGDCKPLIYHPNYLKSVPKFAPGNRVRVSLPNTATDGKEGTVLEMQAGFVQVKMDHLNNPQLYHPKVVKLVSAAKFAIGDRVRLSCKGSCLYGKTATVTRPLTEHSVEVLVEGISYPITYGTALLELIPPPTLPPGWITLNDKRELHVRAASIDRISPASDGGAYVLVGGHSQAVNETPAEVLAKIASAA